MENSMSLEQVFYVSQSIAGFAIVISMAFVGLEMRVSNRESRHRTMEETLTDYREVRFQMMANNDIADIWLRGLHEFKALNPVEKVRFLLLTHAFFENQQSVYLHFREGLTTREMWVPVETMLGALLGYPGLQTAWDVRKNYFHKSFRTLMDDKVAEAQRLGTVPSLYHEETDSSAGDPTSKVAT
jgi:hypothetical protein